MTKARRAMVRTLSRNWPFVNGSGWLIDRLGRGRTLGEGRRMARTSDGFDMAVFADDHIGKHILLSGKFDRSIPAMLLDFCEPGDRCADIGANIGYVACLLLQRVRDSHVLCIEPQPGIVTLLEENLARFPRDRWTLVQAALSDAESEGFLELDHVNRGASALVGAAGSNTVAVPMLPADRVLGACERLDIVKIDIEGHEEIVFRSAHDVLKRLQPRAILFEDRSGKAAPAGSIGALLDSAGYRILGIRKTLTATRLEPVTGENTGMFNDFIAASRTRVMPRRAIERHAL